MISRLNGSATDSFQTIFVFAFDRIGIAGTAQITVIADVQQQIATAIV